MPYNARLTQLHAYPFTKLNALLDGVKPDASKSKISLAIGEPQHPAPDAVLAALQNKLSEINRYPSTKGELALREAIAAWLNQRYGLDEGIIDEENILPALGTREALFAVAQCFVDADDHAHKPLVLMPSPFYQIYEGAAIMAGALPHYLPATEPNGFNPDFKSVPIEVWEQTQLLYVCNPANPTGATLSVDEYLYLLEKAVRYDFIICSDECYSEIYPDESMPVKGVLDAVQALPSQQAQQEALDHCLVFNSLSKRSNLAGMRSGFVAGGRSLIEHFLLYRTYHGSAMALHHQFASVAAWSDEQHVVTNREQYRVKMLAARERIAKVPQLALAPTHGGFCLWVKVPGCDQAFASGLYEKEHIVVLPGSFLARDIAGQKNPGSGYIRIALVQAAAECDEAIKRLCSFAEEYDGCSEN